MITEQKYSLKFMSYLVGGYSAGMMYRVIEDIMKYLFSTGCHFAYIPGSDIFTWHFLTIQILFLLFCLLLLSSFLLMHIEKCIVILGDLDSLSSLFLDQLFDCN